MNEQDTSITLKVGHFRKRHKEITAELENLTNIPDPQLLNISRIDELTTEALDVIQRMSAILKEELEYINEEITLKEKE